MPRYTCSRAGGTAAHAIHVSGLPTQLGQYTDSHSDAVTHLAFHPTAPAQLVSASEDGLLCVFDVRAKAEDDALVTVVPTEYGCPQAVGLFGPSSAFAYCATDMGGLTLWNLATADQVGAFTPDALRKVAGQHGVSHLPQRTSSGAVCSHAIARAHGHRSSLMRSWTACTRQRRND